MTRMMIDVRRGVLVALGAMLAAASASAAESEVAGEVTVQAERPVARVVGRSSSGIPVVQTSVQYRVSYSDLELSIPSNAKVLKTRIRDAAREACADLDRLYGIAASDSDCSRKAEEGAMPQVLSAIAAAEARKTAQD